MARTGRRPGDADTRATILAAARGRFAAAGFRGATIRGIAADAGVDPALVHHYFGSKRELFGAVLEFPVSPELLGAAVADAAEDELGERVIRTFLRVWDDPDHADRLRILLRTAVTDGEAATMLQQFVLEALLQPLGARLGTDPEESRRRVLLCASQLIGLALLRHVLQVEPLASARDDELVATYAPTLQRYLALD